MTLNEINALAPGKTLYDSTVTGLHVRAYPNGKKSFFYFYRTRGGTQRRPKIGSFPECSIEEARSRAKALAAKVAIGEDPKGNWDAEKAEMTFGEVFASAMKNHWSEKRFQDSGWAKEVERLWKKNIETHFGKTKVSKLTALEIRKWHKSFSKKPYAGNRSLEVLSKLINFAMEEGLITQGFNPCGLIKSHPEHKRKRFATADEVRTIAPLLQREAKNDPRGVAFIYLLIFSGSRPRFIERAKRTDLVRVEIGENRYGILSLKGKTTDKTGDDESVIIPSQALDLLDSLSPIGDSLLGIKMPSKLWKKIKTEAGCSDLWARDWRRAFASIGLSQGFSSGVIGELLNHKSAQTTKIYARLMDEEKIKAAQSIADGVERLLMEGQKTTQASTLSQATEGTE